MRTKPSQYSPVLQTAFAPFSACRWAKVFRLLVKRFRRMVRTPVQVHVANEQIEK